MSQKSTAKSIKLRTACNQCNATKVKCSGEKTGCNRCQTFQVPCVYAESRVGRVPGIRAKRKPKMNSNESADFTTEANVEVTDTLEAHSEKNATESYELVSSPKPVSHPGSQTPAATSLFEDVMFNWNTEMNEMGIFFNDDFFANPSENEQQQLSLLREDPLGGESQSAFSHSNGIFNVSGLDFDISETQSKPFQVPNRPWPSDSIDADPTALQAHISTAEHLSNGQCVIACSQMILSLERYLMDDLKVLDFILGIIKRVVTQLNPLVELHREKQNTKCLNLFSVICFQIVELLEAGCTNFFAEEMDQNQKTAGFDPLSGNLPGLGFDTFNITSKSQRRWRSQIILDEIQPLSEILRVLGDLMTTNLQDRYGTGTQTAHPDCYSDLIVRLDTLIEQLKR